MTAMTMSTEVILSRPGEAHGSVAGLVVRPKRTRPHTAGHPGEKPR
ncbi:MAG: hypothetical protein M3Y33_21385 [Actinomycetota bacterium]|nr:hypothetical protein [Actinomycetota bacterium]